MQYISNAFSLQMLDWSTYPININIRPIHPRDVGGNLLIDGFESCIGHSDTAKVISNILGIEIPCHRKSVKLHHGDVLYVAQFMGGRLPEGTTMLPEGITIQFFV